MAYYVGVDLGGTNIVCGLMDENLHLLRQLKQPTEAKRGSGHVIGKIIEMARELAAAERLEAGQIRAIGAGIPGFIDPERGICRFAANLGWQDVNVTGLITEKTGIPSFIDNDVRMYTLGEAMGGAGRGFDVVFGITLGTGIAACLVDRGRIYYGGGHMAGEIGHIRMEGESSRCGCGMNGCLETVASATGIARLARQRIECGESSVMTGWVDDLAELKAAHVSKAYDEGDALAVQVLTYAGTLLGRGLSYAIPLLSPDVIVVGGGAANAGERILAATRAEIARLSLQMYVDRIQIKVAEHLDDAGVIGSAAYARGRLV